MKIYLFVQRSSSSGGNIIACYPEDKRIIAFDYISNHPNKDFLYLYQAEWDGYGEFPTANGCRMIVERGKFV